MSDALTLEYLRRSRCASVPGLSNRQAIKARAHLRSCSVYPGCHVPPYDGRVASNFVSEFDTELLSHNLTDVLRAPHLVACALRHHSLAAAYLETDQPTFYSANVFWTRPGSTFRPDLNGFHQDPDDVRFIVLFIYLTDVLDMIDGPHTLQSPDGGEHMFFGPAGAAFLSDTSNPHRGVKPLRGERGIFWARWGISPVPTAYVNDHTKPIPRSFLGELDYNPTDSRLHMLIKGDE